MNADFQEDLVTRVSLFIFFPIFLPFWNIFEFSRKFLDQDSTRYHKSKTVHDFVFFIFSSLILALTFCSFRLNWETQNCPKMSYGGRGGYGGQQGGAGGYGAGANGGYGGNQGYGLFIECFAL